MVLTATVVGGLVAGAVWGFSKRAFVAYGTVWVLTLAVETAFLVDSSERQKPAYWILAAIFFLVGVALIGVGTWVRGRSEGVP